jgi:hypothetical protein
MSTHPGESPAAAAFAVRSERPPAEVIDVKEGARRRAARQGDLPRSTESPSPLPPWFVDGRRRVLRVVAEAIQRTSDMLALPGTALRVIRDIRRHREA